MQAYLASKYMSGPKADAILARTPAGDRPKKKKRKVTQSAAAAGGARIQDDDEPGFVDVPEAAVAACLPECQVLHLPPRVKRLRSW